MKKKDMLSTGKYVKLEIEYLLENEGKISEAEMADHIGRTEKSVQTYFYKLNKDRQLAKEKEEAEKNNLNDAIHRNDPGKENDIMQSIKETIFTMNDNILEILQHLTDPKRCDMIQDEK